MDKALKFKVASALLEKYCFYRRKWVRMEDNQVQTIKYRYTDGDVMNHLDGNYSLCVFAGEHATNFITIDIDLGEPEVVRKVVDTMVDLGIPRELIYVSFSGRKGYHVDIFFENFIYNSIAEKFYWALIERSGLNPRKVEFRPTHRQAIKLPLGIHQLTGNRCWYVDRETLEPIEDFEYIFTIERIPQEYMNRIVNEIVNEHMRSIYEEIRQNTKFGGSTSGAYNSLEVTERGTRHNIQAKVAARARMDGNDFDDIVRIQMDWYSKQDKTKIASSEDEVLADAERLAEWAMKNVDIKPHQKKETRHRTIRITKSDIPYILSAPTKSTRKVLFLLILFSKIYDTTKLSYKTISEYVGVSEPAVRTAVRWLVENKYIGKKSTSCRKDKFVSLRGSNVYSFPGEHSLRATNARFLLADHADVCDIVFPEVYYRTLATMCKPEYLARFLTKPELKECEKY